MKEKEEENEEDKIRYKKTIFYRLTENVFNGNEKVTDKNFHLLHAAAKSYIIKN